MKKGKFTSLMLAGMMAMTTLAGCGSGTKQAASKVDTSEAAQGKVLNIYCWNTEFQDRFEYFKKSGKLPSDVKVNFVVTPNENNAYQNALDAALLKQNDVPADEKIDIFLIEADYALKYVDSDYTLDVVNDIGLSKDALADQYQYTKDIVTDSKGVQKGTTWQATPGLFAYRRSIAKEVLGTDDPDQVQAQLSSWDKFNAVAEKASEKGYKMLSGYDDSYRVFSNNVSGPWVDSNNKIVIDDNIMKWVDDSKELVDAGETGTYELWSDDWKKGFYPEGNVFCYFGPAWLVNFSMAADTEGSIGYNGGWGATEGPQGFFWGGTWICAATGTDNQSLVKDILLQMTTNDDVMREIIEKDDDFVNNQDVIVEMADSSYASKILGGQNPLGIYNEGVSKLDLSNLSSYDQGCNEEFQHAMKNYFEGSATKEEALDLFYKSVLEKYPELTY